MTVAAALAEAHHHSAPKVGAETHVALRRQKTASAGARPGVLEDPAPQGAVTVGYVAAPVPLLSTPSLADTAAEAVDARTVKFLLQQSLARKKKEEEEEERRKVVAKQREEKYEAKMTLLNDRVRLDLPLTEAEWAAWRQWMGLVPSSSSSARRRKRKKRRKRRTPRSPRPLLRGRARRRQRQRHVPVSPFDIWSMSLLCGTCGFHRCNDEICADYFIYFRFKLNGKGRSEQWEVFLYCDKTIKVDRDCVEVLPWGVPLPDIGGVGFGSSPNLDTKHTIYELCLPSERGCVAMSCGGGFCSPDGAYDSVWDKVEADDWKISSSIISSTKGSLGVYAC